MRLYLPLSLALFAVGGCASSNHNRAWVDRQWRDRTGTTACASSPGRALPNGVSLDDGLSELEVVSVALCRSPTLRAERTRIDAAFATLDEARRPANPQLSMMGPIGVISAVATLLVPLESLWQMPSRTEAAARDADIVGESVLMRGLDVVRDARLLHVELGLAEERVQVRRSLAQTALELARIAAVRAESGDISPLEERIFAADARTSADALQGAETEVRMASARLAATLALDAPTEAVRAVFAADVTALPSLGALLGFARDARPDARASELSIAAAAARARWERTRIVNLSALVETQWNQPAGPALRLGGRVDLPLFNQNQGGIGRADAEVERAAAMNEQLARTVVMEVTLAHARFEQAARSRRTFENEVMRSLDGALDAARRGFESGDQPYSVVLDVLRRVAEAQLRKAEIVAEQRRALCELERAIGARLDRAPQVAADARTERGGA
ncbi:MAG: TolC family protein [Polyangiales bacterium]